MASYFYSALVLITMFVLSTVMGTEEIMSHVTAHFGQTLEECREESGLSREAMEHFKQFWNEEYEVVDRELGCAIICMSNKFSLMHEDARIHHVNVEDYVRTFPKGQIISAKVVDLLHNCEKQYDDVEDECIRVVKMAACFKLSAKKEGIAPNVAMIEAVLEN